MKAVVWHDIGKISLDTVPDPTIRDPYDVVVRLTASAICGTDLHMIRGTLPDMKPGTILGHEGVGVVEAVGKNVRNFRAGDRVVVPSTVSCGACPRCRAGDTAQCDVANPNGPDAGTCFFGGPAASGPIDGMQAEYVRVPLGHATLIPLPHNVSDDQAITISDIFTTGWFGAEQGGVGPGSTVAVFGCGPVGLFAIASARLMGAGRIVAVDTFADRLAMARAQGAEAIDFNADDPVATIKELTHGVGVDVAIDAVGVDANAPDRGPAHAAAKEHADEFRREVATDAPDGDPHAKQYRPGDAPSQVLRWAAQAVRKSGTLSIIGVYPLPATAFPIGAVLNRNLTVRAGNCNHRAIEPKLVELVAAGVFDPTTVITEHEPMGSAIDAYEHFDERGTGWTKVVISP